MKKNTKLLYISEIIMLLAIVSLLFTIKNPSYSVRMVFVLTFLGISFVVLLEAFGWKKDNSYLKNNVVRSLISILLSYLIIIYLLGLILGFSKGFTVVSKNYILTLGSSVLFILGLESIRYIIAKNSLNSKKPIIIFTILSIILNVLLELNINNLITSEEKFIFLSTIIFPIVAEELLCSFLTYKISMFPSLLYKLVIKLYMFIIPIVPNLGNYIYSTINIIFPYIIYFVVNKTIIRYEKVKENVKKANITVFSIPLILLLIMLIILVSGLFKYKMIAIASNSMHPAYDRGDAVIYEKVDSEEIEEGEILVFHKEGKIVTHRVTKKWSSNGIYYFKTKGDQNNAEDAWETSSNSVLGRVVFSFKYIGYPTVLINEFFGKE